MYRKTSEFASFRKKIAGAKNILEKIALLDATPSVTEGKNMLKKLGFPFSQEEEYVLKALIFLRQWEVVFSNEEESSPSFTLKLQAFLNSAIQIDHFYREIGGLIGYQYELLRLMQRKKKEKGQMRIYPPLCIDISKEDKEIQKAISWGIHHLPEIGELYPIGGAADRLHLQDPTTHEELPAAKLLFAGKTLLQYLIDDVAAKEHLYYKLYGKKVLTPIAMMTSHEKNNHKHILNICEEEKWFKRPKESFHFFTQPLVPTITSEGKWCMKETLAPLYKPGGHGVIWKLAKECGVFSWFQGQGRRKALIRQINNPIAGVDSGLLAFAGIGCHNDMSFGFASCPREANAAEGINVLREKRVAKGFSYHLSNIEYCDFAKYSITKMEAFPSNTNILFVDLKEIEKVVVDHPFPGPLVNLKNIRYFSKGSLKEERVGRLEMTMQNIVDSFVETYPVAARRRLKKVFITMNERKKTISTAKKVYFSSGSTIETPERCFYDFLCNAHELLTRCRFTLPLMPSLQEYLEKGPSFIFSYHPTLGPLYSIIKKKLSKGKLHKQSELHCHLSDLYFDTVEVNGSFIIRAENPTQGRCFLRNVRILNEGIDYAVPTRFWSGEMVRKEMVKIHLQEGAEFYAENVTFRGNHLFEVKSGYRLKIKEHGGKLSQEMERVADPSWSWKYELGNQQILLKRQ